VVLTDDLQECSSIDVEINVAINAPRRVKMDMLFLLKFPSNDMVTPQTDPIQITQQN